MGEWNQLYSGIYASIFIRYTLSAFNLLKTVVCGIFNLFKTVVFATFDLLKTVVYCVFNLLRAVVDYVLNLSEGCLNIASNQRAYLLSTGNEAIYRM